VSRSARARAARLRRGRLSDLDSLITMEENFFTADHQISRRGFRRFIRSPRSSLIVADANGIVAGCVLVNYRRGSPTARLYTIAVAREFQGRGLARRLLADAEKKAVGRGRRTMRLEVRADDAAAIHLYQTSGYRPIGRRPRYYAGRIDALLFDKTLRTGNRDASRRLIPGR
jgi:ribosomal protein S18 acetylase RimI-like enzyme